MNIMDDSPYYTNTNNTYFAEQKVQEQLTNNENYNIVVFELKNGKSIIGMLFTRINNLGTYVLNNPKEFYYSGKKYKNDGYTLYEIFDYKQYLKNNSSIIFLSESIEYIYDEDELDKNLIQEYKNIIYPN